MLLIRCPQCKAVFRANENQLKSRRGRVRCGKCAASFNGLENVVEAPPAPPPAPAPAPAPAAPPPVAPAPQPKPKTEPAAKPQAQPRTAPQPEAAAESVAAAPLPAPAPSAPPEPVAAEAVPVPVAESEPEAAPAAEARVAPAPPPQPEAAEPEPVAPAESLSPVPEPVPAPPPAAKTAVAEKAVAEKAVSMTVPVPVPAPVPVPQPVPAPQPAPAPAKPKAKTKPREPEPPAPPPVAVQERQEPSFGPVPSVAATAGVAVPEIRIEPGEHGVPSEPMAEPPRAPRKPLFAPGQLRRVFGMLLLAVSVLSVVYLLIANWARIVPIGVQLWALGARLLAKPVVQALLLAVVLTALVFRTTRRPKKKPSTPETQAVETLYEVPEEAGHFWRWTFVSLLLIGALVAQAVYAFRTEIAILAPDARPALERVCAAAGCTVPLPRRSDLVSIETSDLHPVPGRNDQLQLIATVKNRAFYRQDWPHLEVTLTDTRDKPVVRRVFAPAEYLPEESKSAPGFNGNQELQLDLTLQVDGAIAAGYRLYVFYP